jgi:uncharacterized protein (TIGR02217 family)
MITLYAGFHDLSFPVPVARGARVTTRRQTEIVTLGSGHEERNTRWRYAKRTYDAGGGVRSQGDLYAVQSFFEARFGQLYAFRFRDPLDHASGAPGTTPTPTDQGIGTGDGVTKAFQLVKTYSAEHPSPVRPIKLPVAGSVQVAVDGVVDPAATCDPLTGLATFPSAPANGASITAGFLFDVPARFDSDRIDIDMTAFKAGSLPSIPLIEVFLKESQDA